MNWQGLAGITSVTYALQNLLVKWLSLNDTDTRIMLWFMVAVATPLLMGVFLWVSPPPPRPLFYLYLSLGLAGNLLAYFGYVRSISLSDVSLVTPLISLTPLFMLLTSWLMLGEFPDPQGLIGVLAVVVGTYFLARESGMSPLEPLRRLFAEKGTRWALVASVVWSIMANVDKLAIRHASPMTHAFWFNAGMALLLLPLLIYRGGNNETDEKPGLLEGFRFTGTRIVLGGLIGLGLLQAGMSIAQLTAIMRTDVTYVIAVKRASMLISVLGGGLLFGERDLGRRFASSVLVFAGLVGIMFR